MIDVLLVLIWVGGMPTVYGIERYRSGFIHAAMDAFIWPFGIGVYVARRFYRVKL